MINLIVALQCEAKPLIKQYRLNGSHSDGFRIYQRDQIRLIISGVGKLASAAATAYLQGMEPDACNAWLNIGIAGHPTLAVGEPILAKEIIDYSSGQIWRPPLIFEAPCRRETLITIDKPDNQYKDVCAHDMEAAGFYATALRLNTTEAVQVFKVISDNNDHPQEKISAAHAEAIIDGCQITIDNTINQLQTINTQLQQQTDPPAEAAAFMHRWHFTITQQHQLIRLLQRWQALATDTPLDVLKFTTARNSKEVLKQIEVRLKNLPLVY